MLAVDRLGQIIVHAGGEAAFPVTVHGVGGHRDDRLSPLASGHFGRADPARCFEPVHDRHHHVHQHDVEAFATQPINGGLAVLHQCDAVTPAFEQPDRQLLVDGVVFDEQNGQRRSCSRRRLLVRARCGRRRALVEGASERVQELVAGQRFAQLAGDSEAPATLAVALPGGCGDDQQEHRLAAGECAQPSGERVRVAVAKIGVEQRQVHRVWRCRKPRHGCRAGFDGAHRRPGGLQRACHDGATERLRVDDENASVGQLRK
ncbi:MAG: hypothetical protein AW11_02003 [Candidatus Accumulibacter regalis]|uniref:Uncharacterized protein n=1 Tax=Accumulibacter regalis TaxID=522306 RepID=A0A011QIP1_ACCRE|nr:MAG: hypothetical protein AW11_02003 [Candidatus Accumulibacter regalis]